MSSGETLFRLYGTSHWSALAVIVAAWGGLRFLSTRQDHLALHRAEQLLGLLLLATPVLTFAAVTLVGPMDLQAALPLHYCDVATIASGVALLRRHPAAVEVAYFFGLAGTLQGLITPALQLDFPHPRYFHFFFIHGGVVITALHLVWTRGIHPRTGSIQRMMLLTSLYALVVGGINAILRTNFGFLCRKPPNASLIDALGPWPWYIGSLLLLSLIFYTILDLPFWTERRQAQNPTNKS